MAQGAQLRTLGCLRGVRQGWGEAGAGVGGRLKREKIHVHTQLVFAVVQQKLTQHYKATALHFF